MTGKTTLLGVIFLIAAGNLTLALLVWARAHRGIVVARVVVLLLALSEWTLAYGILLLLPGDSPWKIPVANLQYLGAAVAPVYFVLSILHVTGQAWPRNRATAWLLMIEPLLFNLAIWTDPWHHLYRTSLVVVHRAGIDFLAPTYGPVLWVSVAYAYVLELLACAALVRAFRRTATRQRPMNLLLIIAACAPLVANLVNLLHLDPTPIDSTHYGFFISGVCLFLSISRYRLIPISPGRVTERILHAISDFILLADPEGLIVWSNEAATKVLGHPGGRLRGTPYPSLLSLVDGQKLLPGRFLEDPSFLATDVEADFRHLDGSTIPVSLSLTALRDVSGTIEGFLLVGRDLRERRRLQEQRASMIRLESIRRLAGGVAHDFNNILTPVGAYAEYVAGKLSPDDVLGSYLQRIVQSVERASRQADRLLLISGQYAFQTAPVVLDDALRDVEPLLKEAAAPVTLRLAPRAPGVLVAIDTGLVSWGLDILVRHAAAGSPVAVDVRSAVDSVTTDDGSPDDRRPRRFARVSIDGGSPWTDLERDVDDAEPYRFGMDSIEASSDLSIVRRIVALHGGLLTVADGGTTVVLSLPIHEG